MSAARPTHTRLARVGLEVDASDLERALERALDEQTHTLAPTEVVRCQRIIRAEWQRGISVNTESGADGGLVCKVQINLCI